MRKVIVAMLLALSIACLPSLLLGADKPDLSTPKKAAMAFAKAVGKADMDAVKEATVGSEKDYKLVQSLLDLVSASHAAHDAAIEKFGEEKGKDVIAFNLDELQSEVEQGEEKIDGQTASVGKPEEKEPMKLKKVDDQWKVDLGAIPDRQQMEVMMPVMLKVMKQAADDLKADKYKTAEEAKKGIEEKMEAAASENAPKAPAAPEPPAPQK